MNNELYQVHLVPTDKPSELYIGGHTKTLGYTEGFIPEKDLNNKSQHLYFTSNEEIKEGDWYIDFSDNKVGNLHKCRTKPAPSLKSPECQKIEVATNPELWTREGSKETYHVFTGIGNIPQSFIDLYIKRYNEGSPIKEVRLEINPGDSQIGNYGDDWQGKLPSLKLTPEGYVIVKPEEEKVYTSDDMFKAYSEGCRVASPFGNQGLSKLEKQNWPIWFERNYPK